MDSNLGGKERRGPASPQTLAAPYIRRGRGGVRTSSGKQGGSPPTHPSLPLS